MKKILIFIAVGLLCISSIQAVGGKPDKKEKSSEKPQSSQPQSNYSQPVEIIGNMGSADFAASDTPVELTDDQLDIVDKYKKYLKQKQFIKAKEQLALLPPNALTRSQIQQKRTLYIFEQIALDQAENERQFGKDDSLDQDVTKTVKRLQREAKNYILKQEKDLSRDILIQSLYLDRKNYDSKQLLERCLNLPLGSYRVENVEAKYWKESLIQLRSGYPAKSVDSLTVLASFDPENPSIFERMGSWVLMS